MKYNSPEFRKWLDKLQQESWQLELIISGFAIYGLFAAFDPMELSVDTARASNLMLEAITWNILIICWYILVFNLTLHVLLRGLWIGAIGLRYVSGDIDYQKLNYSEKFTQYLKRKVGSFDRYIARLENYCSVLFAITFLLVFYVIGFFSVIFIVAGIIQLLTKLSFIPDDIISTIKAIIRYTLIITASITFIDFIGQGVLKKRKWTSKLYFPIYWVFSILTLSFLYRPLAYNFLDNRFGKRLSILLVPIYIGLTLLSFTYYKNSNFSLDRAKSSQNFGYKFNYENESEKKSEFIEFASIPSKVIQTPFLKIFIIYNEEMEDFVLDKNPDLSVENDSRGYTNAFFEGINTVTNDTNLLEKKELSELKIYLDTFKNLYSIRIDSALHCDDFIVSNNQKNRLGFETYLNIRYLAEGKHVLTITGPTKKDPLDMKSEKIEKTLVTIPFWYYPENSSAPINNQIMEVDSLTNK